MTGGLEILPWGGEGYQPLVFSHDWMVSILNWEPIFQLQKLGEVERHNQTDEVFVLTRGKAVIFTSDDHTLRVEEMVPGVIYNVVKGTWHNLTATRGASFIIVEDRDTHLNDCEFRPLTGDEKSEILKQMPSWAE